MRFTAHLDLDIYACLREHQRRQEKRRAARAAGATEQPVLVGGEIVEEATPKKYANDFTTTAQEVIEDLWQIVLQGLQGL